MTDNVQSKPDYSIDAPSLLRFFFIAGAVALAIFFVVLFSSVLEQIPKIIVGTLLGIAVTYLLGMGFFMLYGSKVMKLKDRDKLLNLIQWSGSELVLDVGCGTRFNASRGCKALDLWKGDRHRPMAATRSSQQ
jgi:hypothetical protein